MSVQKILQAGNPELRKNSKSVQNFDKRIQKLIKDLEDTLTAQKDPEGVGLAAVQTGVSSRLFLLKLKGKSLIFANPEITWMSKDTNDPPSHASKKTQEPNNPRAKEPEQEYIMEGCLSLPHFYGPVKRAKSIIVKYERPEMVDGQWIMVKKAETLRDLPAQIVQHEVDHLNGKLFIDHLLSQKRKLYHWTGKDWEEVELP